MSQDLTTIEALERRLTASALRFHVSGVKRTATGKQFRFTLTLFRGNDPVITMNGCLTGVREDGTVWAVPNNPGKFHLNTWSKLIEVPLTKHFLEQGLYDRLLPKEHETALADEMTFTALLGGEERDENE